MSSTIRNVFGVTTGIVVGGLVNMGLILLGGEIIPPPDGVDVTSMENMSENIHLFEPHHFLFPFLAHAIGTLAGAYLAALIALSHKMTFALIVGGFFLIGGIVNVYMLPAPLWFIVVDLVGAYLPMGWLAGKWEKHRRRIVKTD